MLATQRREIRSTFNDHDRIILAEDDLDTVDRKYESMDARLDKIFTACVGILISTTTAAVLLAINLVVKT